MRPDERLKAEAAPAFVREKLQVADAEQADAQKTI
jgi:hypothetical protein